MLAPRLDARYWPALVAVRRAGRARSDPQQPLAEALAPARLEELLQRRAQQKRDAERHEEEHGEHRVEALTRLNGLLDKLSYGDMMTRVPRTPARELEHILGALNPIELGLEEPEPDLVPKDPADEPAQRNDEVSGLTPARSTKGARWRLSTATGQRGPTDSTNWAAQPHVAAFSLRLWHVRVPAQRALACLVQAGRAVDDQAPPRLGARGAAQLAARRAKRPLAA